MKLFHFALILFLTSFGNEKIFADKPLSKNFPETDITGIVLAKFQEIEGKGMVAVRIPAWKETMTTETYSVEVPVVRTEEVTEVIDGKERVRTVNVTSTAAETRTKLVATYTAKDPVKGEVAIEKIKAWNMKGEPLTTAKLKESLSKTVYLVCLYAEPAEGVPPLDPFFANAFRSDALIVFSEDIDMLLGDALEPAPERAGFPADAAPAPPEAAPAPGEAVVPSEAAPAQNP